MWKGTITETEKLILAETDNWCFYVKNANGHASGYVGDPIRPVYK